jgi:hypothetical protein
MPKRKIKMRVSYETNRLAEAQLFSAYEKLMPTIKKQLKKEEEAKNNNDRKIQELKVRGI